MDALNLAVRADPPAAAPSRDLQPSSSAADSASFKSTLAAQSGTQQAADHGDQESTQQAADKPDSDMKSQRRTDNPDEDPNDEGAQDDKAAAAAATLAQMLAGAQPVPTVTGLSATYSFGQAQSGDATAGKTGSSETLPTAPSALAAEPAVAAGSVAASSALAALTAAIDAEIKPLPAVATDPDTGAAAQKSATVSNNAPSSPGAAALTLFANPLRQASLTAVLDQGSGQALQSPVGSSEWAEELGTRLAVMTAQGDQSGSLRLSPEHLGPLEVQIRMQDDKANVVFGAQHADTRRALEEALPRLRELFAASGLQLGDAGVSREAPRQSQVAWAARTNNGLGNIEAEIAPPITGVVSRQHLGLVDTVA